MLSIEVRILWVPRWAKRGIQTQVSNSIEVIDVLTYIFTMLHVYSA